MLPEITVTELSEKLKSDASFILLDVREPVELGYAKITDSRL
jgi:rhodanese-related sulfurtransferase